MEENPPIWIILTTYGRTEIALQTIQGMKQNFLYPNLGWILCDDGTGGDHIEQLTKAIGPEYATYVYDGQRRGVGHNMNWGINKVQELGGELFLMNEGDWYCRNPYDPTPAVRLLMNHEDIGMVRLGYMSPGIAADVIAEENKLWLKFRNDGFTYVFTGHASLRHSRFHQRVGKYTEGLPPGRTELAMCGAYNATPDAPAIVWDLEYGHQGPFVHIGAESTADIMPEQI